MPITENISAFFADFGVVATWTPSNGGAAQSATVFLDANDDIAQFEGFAATAQDIMMTYDATAFIGLAQDETLSIGGIGYRVVRPPRVIDAAIMRATLGVFA